MSKCVFAGCFDPFTIGHLDVIKRLSSLYEKVYVVVSKNAEKRLVASGSVRYEMVKKAVDIDNVEVGLHEGLLVDFCREKGVRCIVKGVRNLVDFEYESLQANVNKELGGVDTLFLPCSDTMAFISSSFVREMLSYGRDVSAYVPREILDDVKKYYVSK